ncbi:50S ribosomal protein L21 [Alloyangia pacifica]|uniref:Large ribosomal subunit protein bL21 n=2 Tax=Alloyangia TaxID=2919626 RepID=A0A2U8HD18_9RHOB|nr:MULTISPECIES: 50S ribosomal protein L21 [Roseobacteraceae]AWI83580.1 50S ribosomal protein L21 [Alloyangia pacifica]MCA0941013.1 50S ribosomal protein L21 [Alloyangia pacifica]MCA0944353.1 50S ribosomal protein L21 [Alloyangia pacifica]MCT4369552.1 50S ribosomal protein L21 [Alloyangia mangrovi]NDV52471.1 50S ribosomal protein L21 [Salipiger sp. PrR003]
MFAVMKTGGKQYKVQAGDVLRVEKLAADAGETVQFNEVLILGGDSVTVGAPLVSGAAVQATVIDQIKGEKVIKFVKRRRKHGSQRTRGHRQQLTLLRVTEILASGAEGTGVKAAAGAASAPKAAAPKAAAAAAGDDLTKITGVGPAAAKKLNEAGIATFAQLAAVDPESFDAVKVKPEWVEQAKTLA